MLPGDGKAGGTFSSDGESLDQTSSRRYNGKNKDCNRGFLSWELPQLQKFHRAAQLPAFSAFIQRNKFY